MLDVLMFTCFVSHAQVAGGIISKLSQGANKTLLEKNSTVLHVLIFTCLCLTGPDRPENHLQAHLGGQQGAAGRELSCVMYVLMFTCLGFLGPDSPEYFLQA